jgi:hypothetical protein
LYGSHGISTQLKEIIVNTNLVDAESRDIEPGRGFRVLLGPGAGTFEAPL